MQILQVIPLTQSIDTEVLTYFSIKDVSLGTIVTVPLRKKNITAIVMQAEPVINMKTQLRGANYQIRNITEIHTKQIFSPAFLKTCNQLKNYYATTTGRIINRLTPSFITKNIEEWKYKKNIQDNISVFNQKLLQRNYHDRVSFYKTLIREKMLRKESLHIICPTIEDTKRLFLKLEKNNQSDCFLFHSELTKKQFKEKYQEIIARDKHSIIISTAIFIDTPQVHKSTIIIEQESSEYYRTIAAPYVDLRNAIAIYAQNANIECIWADTVLRPEVWHLHRTKDAELITPFNKKIFKQGDITLITQHTKKPGKQTDAERIADLSEKKKFSAISKEARESIKKAIRNKEKIFLYVHRKSLAPSIVCNDCGHIARSPETGHPYSLYIKTNKKTRVKERIFICHITGETLPAFDSCQFCQSWNLITLGIGTESVFEEVQNLFPKIETYIIDSVHTKTKKSIKEISDKYQTTNRSIIIIGTQKALPILQEIDTSLVVSLDSYFGRMSYSINPQVVSLLGHIKQKTKNSALLQSRNILETSLPIINDGLYIPFIENELSDRKDFKYPPFTTLIIIKRTIKKEYAKKEYISLYTLLKDYHPNILMRPGNKKGFVEVVMILHINIRLWNINFQDNNLWNILTSFNRSTQIHINPKDLI